MPLSVNMKPKVQLIVYNNTWWTSLKYVGSNGNLNHSVVSPLRGRAKPTNMRLQWTRGTTNSALPELHCQMFTCTIHLCYSTKPQCQIELHNLTYKDESSVLELVKLLTCWFKYLMTSRTPYMMNSFSKLFDLLCKYLPSQTPNNSPNTTNVLEHAHSASNQS
jgi:hypothetical protein